VVRNSGTNQDGRTPGITLPSGKAQVELIDRLYKSAGLDPVQTSYVEAHGTGTAAGDPIEAASLSKIFAVGRLSHEPLRVGSIKSNIGHLEGGSGVAGVVKTVLMLEKNLILPNFDFKNANPRIPIQDWKLKVFLLQSCLKIERNAYCLGSNHRSGVAYQERPACFGQQFRVWG
jgi:acyl transferase domain-containing protein